MAKITNKYRQYNKLQHNRISFSKRCVTQSPYILHVYDKKKVQVGKDQEKAQSEKDSHSKNRGEEKTQLTIRYLYHENIS